MAQVFEIIIKRSNTKLKPKPKRIIYDTQLKAALFHTTQAYRNIRHVYMEKRKEKLDG